MTSSVSLTYLDSGTNTWEDRDSTCSAEQINKQAAKSSVAAAGIKLNGGCRPLLKGLYVTLLSPNLSFAGAGRASRGWCFRGDVRCSDWYAGRSLTGYGHSTTCFMSFRKKLWEINRKRNGLREWTSANKSLQTVLASNLSVHTGSEKCS